MITQMVVYNQWTGLVDWTGGLDWWTGLVDWTGGLDWWTGLVDWTGGLDWWTGLGFIFLFKPIFCQMVVATATLNVQYACGPV